MNLFITTPSSHGMHLGLHLEVSIWCLHISIMASHELSRIPLPYHTGHNSVLGVCMMGSKGVSIWPFGVPEWGPKGVPKRVG